MINLDLFSTKAKEEKQNTKDLHWTFKPCPLTPLPKERALIVLSAICTRHAYIV